MRVEGHRDNRDENNDKSKKSSSLLKKFGFTRFLFYDNQKRANENNQKNITEPSFSKEELEMLEKYKKKSEIEIAHSEHQSQKERDKRKKAATDVPIWTHEEISEEFHKARLEVEKEQNKLREKWSKIHVLNGFPVEQAWRLCVDRRYQGENGPKFRVNDEPSFLAGTMKLFNATLDGLCIKELEFDGHSEKKLTGQYFQELHDISIADMYREVKVGQRKVKFQKGYRGHNNNYNTADFEWTNSNASVQGLYELQLKLLCKKDGDRDSRYGPAGHPVGNSCYRLFDNSGFYVTKEMTGEQCLATADAIIDQYHMEIGKSTNKDDKLIAIVRCCQDLDQAHLLPDGNIRTIAFGVLPKLLLENGFYPTILHDPNILDGYSVAEIKAAVLQGQKDFRSLCSPNASQ